MSTEIIVSLTTVPNRLLESKEHMGTKIGLKTILEQKNIIYKIHFNIPYIYKLTNETIIIPQWLVDYQKQYPHLEIYRTQDFGAITKILPTLERTNNPDTIIITVDDDLYYNEGFIQAHLEARKKYDNYAIGFAGLSALDGSCHFCTTTKKDILVKILEGYKTVSYKRSFFNINELKENFISKTWNDDYVLSAYMGYKNIPKIVLAHTHDTDYRPRVESFPVIGHTPIERGGCATHRESDNTQSEKNINEWYRMGYLER
jgi:hypothetical protein